MEIWFYVAQGVWPVGFFRQSKIARTQLSKLSVLRIKSESFLPAEGHLVLRSLVNFLIVVAKWWAMLGMPELKLTTCGDMT